MARETILIVEDNDVLRQGLQALLEAEGYSVSTAVHGSDALEIMGSIHPDLILSDIAMPEMDGFAFFDTVRTKPDWISIPFIFLTARREREDIFTGKKLGAEDYLVKPVTRHELVTTIRSRLSRSQQLLYAQLQHAYESSLIMLANAIELRDQYTRGHVERVRAHAQEIARHIGWSDTRLNHLGFGSILHDIGKIHIRESVLSKTGPLNEAEWVEMKKHPLIGAEMVKNIPFLVPAIPVILYHHERWDGLGYPHGMSGEDIPLGARIVAVADSLDAMTTTRGYRIALTQEEAYKEIQRCSGSHYDPAVVDAFQHVWNTIRKNMR
ncbi:MAG TPA: HD domain-containing phosphohydrolase [Anaerolineales bacterium]|nr:HD domain-containing phosphohydrolase [Anaerolineales bacterium]